jgi:signal transduction histidine kinase
MGNIIEELLLLAGIRKTDVELEPLDMEVILSEVNKRLAHTIQEYQAELVFPEAWPKAFGYAPWVEEIWVNYLSNALKYGGRPPRVELGATKQADGMVRFWVRDNGPGLSRAEQSRLFVPFTKLAQVRVEGFGLGLSIVRRIVDKLGGQVGVESEGVPGRGSTFSFTLPSGPVKAAAATQ